MTEAQVDTDTQDKLGKIFFPFSHQAAGRVYAGGQPGKFAHYTSAETALNIIRQKRLWMRSTTCMADYREVAHGHDMLAACFDGGTRQKFRDTLDECRKGVADEAIKLFDQHWADTLFNTFVTCVSEHQAETEDNCGRLSMWRAFAPNTTRVALIFALPQHTTAVQKLSLAFAPVAYLSKNTMQDQLDQVIANIRSEKDYLSELPAELLRAVIFAVLLASNVGVKHEGFHEEREWRAVYGPYRWPSDIMTRQMSVEPVSGVPQRIYRIPLDAAVDESIADLDFSRIFHRLIIGPSQYGIAMEDAFVRALHDAGVSGAGSRVVRSDIPIRSLM